MKFISPCILFLNRWNPPSPVGVILFVLVASACLPFQSQAAPAPSPDPKAPAAKVAAAASGTAAVSSPSSANLDALFPIGQAHPLFDGATLRGWKITDFAGHGDVSVEKNIKGSPALVMEAGAALTGVTWTNALPTLDYEIELDAIKLVGSDFFCGLTFPVNQASCTFVCGGWGGAVVGLSSIDSQDASMNETTKYMKFAEDRWFHIRVKVTQAKIEAWIDVEKMVDLETTGKKIHMRFGEISESEPFGVATYQTRGALRNFTLKRLAPSAPAK